MQTALKFYINPREAADERPHVHVSRGRGRTNDLKIWLDACTLASVTGEFDRRDVNTALKVAEDLNEMMLQEWAKYHRKAKGRARR